MSPSSISSTAADDGDDLADLLGDSGPAGDRVAATGPKYATIATALRERISAHAMAPHTLMPSEREVAESHGVSRMTARQALSLLEKEGHVYRRPPRGTFVAEPRITFGIGSFSEAITAVGKAPGARVLWARRGPAGDPVAASLRVGAPDGPDTDPDPASPVEVHALQRIRYADAEPIAVETTFFPAALTPGLLDHDLDGSLWALLESRYGVEPHRSRARIESVVIDEPTCEQLAVRATSPGLRQTRLTYDVDGRCVEYAQDVYRADRASFEVEADRAAAPRITHLSG